MPISWTQTLGGDWNTAADWSTGTVPTATDDVTIGASGTYTVTISSGEQAQAHSLTINDAGATVSDSGTLTIGSTLMVSAGTFMLNSGGAISGGTLSASGGSFAWNGGTLNGVTYDGTLDLSANFASGHIVNSLVAKDATGTGNGTINDTGPSSNLSFDGTQSFDNATINVGSTPVLVNGQFTGGSAITGGSFGGGTLTLGQHVTINHTGTIATLTSPSGASVDNQGTINATLAGASFTIGGSFTNDGAINVSNGDALSLSSGSFANDSGATISVSGAGSAATIESNGTTWSNAGQISVTANATGTLNGNWSSTGQITVGTGAALHLGGSFTTGSITNSGGAIYTDGTWTNTGQTLAVGPNNPLGQVVLDSGGGSVVGGTVRDSGSGMQFNGGALNGVTYDGTLDLSANFASVHIVNSLIAKDATGTGNGTINDTGPSSNLSFDGTQSFDNATINVGSTPVLVNGQFTGGSAITGGSFGGGTLTLGQHVTINHTGTIATLTSPSGASVDNQGTINATLAGASFTIGGSFTNDGAINVSNGDALSLSSGSFANDSGATISVSGAGSAATIESNGTTWSNAGQISVTANATGTLNGNWSSTGQITVGTGAALHLGGSFTTGSITNSGGAIYIDGTWTNTGQTLAVGPNNPLGQVVLDSGGGSVVGGTVRDSGSGIQFNGGALNGVTYDGTLDLSANFASGHIVNSLIAKDATGTGNGTINDTGPSSNLSFDGTQSFDNATINVGSTPVLVNGQFTGGSAITGGSFGGGTLTLGQHVTINHTGTIATLTSPLGASVDNQGTINATLAGGSFTIGGSFTNDGAINVSNGDALSLPSGVFTNATGGKISGSGTVSGALTNNGLIDANGGDLDFTDAITGSGRLQIEAASELELGAATGEAAAFAATTGKLRIDNTSNANYTGTITGFGGSDILELANTNATSVMPGTFNGTTTTLTVNLNDGGTLTYTLARDYSSDNFTVTHVNGNADSDITVSGSAAAQLAGEVKLSASTEGTALPSSTVVASFTDSNAGDTAGNFTASINWGDGTSTTTGTVSGSNGTFNVSGGHAYADEGNDTLSVTITDTLNGTAISPNGAVTVAEADSLTPQSTAIAATANQAFNGTVATFTDTDAANVAGDFTTTINWGDGTATTAGTVAGGNGVFTVSGTHTYAATGADTVTVTLTDDGTSNTATATSTANVSAAAAQLAGEVKLSAATEGTALPSSTVVASFTDSNAGDTAGNFTASINWGDGTSTAGTVSGSNGSFNVSGGHAYADEGNDTLSVTITDTLNGTAISPNGAVTVAEADSLTPQSTAIAATANQAFNGTVATFTDTDAANVAGDFTTTINWGDGTATTAGTVAGGNSAFTVSGTHTYAATGADTVTVTLTDDGTSNTATATSTANVSAAAAQLAGEVKLSAATEGTALPSSTVVASFTDSNAGDTAGNFTASINWGDGTSTTTGTVSGSNGTFSVAGGHTYADEGSEALKVTITRTTDNTQLALSGPVAVAEGDALTASPLTITAAVGQPFSGAVATFTDTDAATAAGDFTAAINWGDGTPATVGTVTGGNGMLTVSGTHTYAASGQDTVTVTLADDAPGTATKTASSTANVGSGIGAGLSGSVSLTSTTEGVALAATTVSTFTDPNTSDLASGFTASIAWGDGTSSVGTITGSNGSFTVTGDHTYSDEGGDTLKTTITRTSDNTQLVLSGAVAVAEGDVLTANALTLTATAGQPFSGTVAAFADTDTSNVPSDFSATIDWGDGSPATAGTVGGGNGTFTVSGTHTYATPAQNSLAVTLTEDAPGTATQTATSTTTISAPQLAGEVKLTSATESVAIPDGTTVAAFIDSNTNEVAGDFTASINWGDGTPATKGSVNGGNGSFTVTAGHTYADEESDLLTVTITRTADDTQTPFSGTVTVAENDVLTANALTFVPTAGQPFNGKVATFTNTDTSNVPSDFIASIDWSDGTTTMGTVTGGNGSLTVSGTHTYAAAGQYAVTVTLGDDGSNAAIVLVRGTATATAHSTADVNAPPVTTVPGSQTTQAGVATSIPGISVADADAVSAGETITVTLTDQLGLLTTNTADLTTETRPPGDSTGLVFTGKVDQVNTDLTGLTYLANTAGTDTIDVATSDGRGGTDDHEIAVTVSSNNGQSPPPPSTQTLYDLALQLLSFSGYPTDNPAVLGAVADFLGSLSDPGGFATELSSPGGASGPLVNQLVSSVQQAQQAPPPAPISPESPSAPTGVASGEPHLLTFDGLRYDFQAAGEFILAKGTGGSPFQVQVRLVPYPGSNASFVTQAAIQVGNDRVTIDPSRAQPLWVNAAPASLGANNTLALAAGQIQLAGNQYTIAYNTGETVRVVSWQNAGLNVGVTLGPNDGRGSVQGLLGNDNGNPANDLALPDGSVLPQPISSTILYGQYADAWRVTQSTSLFDYAAGQTTATFTDPNFPQDAITLSQFPGSLVAQATALVQQAGITDPGLQQSAVYDYLVTGNPTFITGDAALQQTGSVNTVAAAQVTVPPPPPLIGVDATAPSITEAASGPTGVTFQVYRTGDTSAPVTVNYAVTSPGSGYVDASAFGGTLPTGQVTIAAGQQAANFAVVLPNGIGSQASEILQVQVSDSSGIAIAAPTAQTTITNNQPLPGPQAGVPGFDLVAGTGKLTQNGSAWTLDLGSIAQGASPSPIELAVTNLATIGADQLSGSFSAAGAAGFTPKLSDAFANLAPGGLYDFLSLGVNTATAGTNSETVTLYPLDVNATGFSGLLPVETLTVTDTITAVTHPGPTAATGSDSVGHNQTVDLTSLINALVTPGTLGDTETLTNVSATSGTAALTNGKVSYTAPATGSDTLSYTVQDQYGDKAAGKVNITVDPGPTAATGSDTVGHNQTVDLTSLINGLVTPGITGDTENLASVSAASGTAALSNGKVSYIAPASGPDTVNYTVQDQYGDKATGKVNITVDPGPTAGTLATGINLGQTVDLTSALLGVDKAGFSGDTLSLVADGTTATLGSLTLSAGKLSYSATGTGLQHIPANGSLADSFTYTVSDQYGDTATGTAKITVNNPADVINGPAGGNAVIQGTSGADIINAFGTNNTINDNGGNDQVNLGGGGTKVSAGGGDVVVNLNRSNNLVSGGDGWDTVTGGSGNNTVTLGNGNDTVNIGGSNNTIALGAGSDTIDAGTGSATVTLSGNASLASNDSLVFHGSGDVLNLQGSGNHLNAAINDQAKGMQINIANGGTDTISNLAADPTALIHLVAGFGGYSNVAAVINALKSDLHGGTLLPLGAAGSIDFLGVASSQLHSSNFSVK